MFLSIILSIAIFSFLQDIPPVYEKIFSQELVQAIAAIIALTKLIRSSLGNIKGRVAVYITMAISLGVGYVQYQDTYGSLVSILLGALAGIVAAGIYKGTKLFGKKVTKLESDK